MPSSVSTFIKVLRKGILLLALVSLFNLVSWFTIANQPSYAALQRKEVQTDIGNDEFMQNSKESYEEATEVSEDPKMGVQEKYEENLKEYQKENPGEGGVIEGVKDIVDKVTSDEK